MKIDNFYEWAEANVRRTDPDDDPYDYKKVQEEMGFRFFQTGHTESDEITESFMEVFQNIETMMKLKDHKLFIHLLKHDSGFFYKVERKE